ncbi:hypothetical protein N6B35_08950 [Klebsiella michiganensis]|uniref:hypothetical protein n=1 Tax=Klebsiella michiganensis TaxID=1134687 RepID=UPI0021DA09C4|nr:hypothetical protein [Klebsiella michiganensis]HCB1752697.1 hypothetical protein [Klebsiella oxytoca]UYB58715.1 hypothetical protein N6B35_08950 [Klebsiella michiganensis]HCB1759678.1 hypothetical protein [Klebsiella oxytoca]HCB1840760.1 hypothetical protein [Klebsiella oxytoca]HCB1894778.1 hypothetical protein [Klebsiella oxytoca]
MSKNKISNVKVAEDLIEVSKDIFQLDSLQQDHDNDDCGHCCQTLVYVPSGLFSDNHH